MATTYDLSDDSVVVVIGSGAGGGTLANELAQKGIDVVCLEAGTRLTLADIENDPPLMNERMGWAAALNLYIAFIAMFQYILHFMSQR